MKPFWKKISSYVITALVSVGATYGMYNYMEYRNHLGSNDSYNYGDAFNQKNVHLSSLTAQGYPDFTNAAENAVHAVVHVKSIVKSQPDPRAQRQGRQRMIDPFEFFFGGDDSQDFQYRSPRPSVGFGSGVLISADGYIITNNHVIDKATDIEITLNDNSKYNAKVIGTDPNTDIALLKIDGKDLPYIPFGDSDKLKIGEWVLAVGNPFNLTSTVTAGIVSAKSRGNIGNMSRESVQSFIQTDAAINPGNSGGALINTDGQLVGINTAIFSETGNFTGYGFAVPISIAGKVVADLKEYGTVQRAVLGVMISDINVAKEASPEKTKNLKVNEGVYVGGFAERSPAQQAGLEEGDVIVAVNGTKIKNVSELQEQISKFHPGDKVKISVIRNNTEKDFSVTLKNNAGDTSVVKKGDAVGLIGATFKELTTEQKKQYGVSYGVEVTGVDNSGKFSKNGVSKGFIILKINNQPVSSQKDVEQLVQTVVNGQDKGLFIAGIYPNGVRKYYAIDLSE